MTARPIGLERGARKGPFLLGKGHQTLTNFQVELDYDEIHQVSLGLINHFEESNISPIEAAAGMTMTIGRLSSDQGLTPDEEIAYVQYIGEVTQAYFAKGSIN